MSGAAGAGRRGGHHARHRGRRWAVVLVAVAAALGLAFYLRSVFNPLLLGLLFAYMLNPLVERLEARGVSRAKAVTVLFGAVLVGVAAVSAYLTYRAARGLHDLRQALTGERVLDPLDSADQQLIAAASVAAEGSDQAAATPPEGGTPPGREPSVVAPRALVAAVRRRGDEYFLDLDGDGERRVGLIERATQIATAQLGPLAVGKDELTRLARGLEEHASSFTEWGIRLTQGLRRSFDQVGTFFSYLLLVPVYTFFLLMSFTEMRDGVRDHLPGQYRAQVLRIARRIDLQVAAFFRGKLTLCLLKGVVTWVGLWITGVPFSFALGLSAGFLSIVPFAGPLVGGALAVFLAFSMPGSLGLALVGIAISFMAAEAIEAVAQPVVLGVEVGMNPVLLLLSFFVFGELFGLFGVLLAVPIMSVVKTLFEELLLPEIRALAADAGEPPGAEAPARAPAVPSFGRR
ncbi:MAG: AI-2E family transporter [Planctomycetota bacterium]